MDSLTARQRAIAAGEKRYHGRPCKKCGGTERKTCDGNCPKCSYARTAARSRERYRVDPDFRQRVQERSRERYANDPEYRSRQKAQRRDRYASNPEVRERERERSREKYWNMSGFEYNRELLRKRRSSALARMTEHSTPEINPEHSEWVEEKLAKIRSQYVHIQPDGRS